MTPEEVQAHIKLRDEQLNRAIRVIGFVRADMMTLKSLATVPAETSTLGPEVQKAAFNLFHAINVFTSVVTKHQYGKWQPPRLKEDPNGSQD